MGKIALPAVVAVSLIVVMPFVAKAEPMVLTAPEMESVTAAALIEVNIPISLGDFRVQFNLTSQVANATAFTFAICGICIGAAPTAFSFAAATNANASSLIQQ